MRKDSVKSFPFRFGWFGVFLGACLGFVEITSWSVDYAPLLAELPLPLCSGSAALVSPRRWWHREDRGWLEVEMGFVTWLVLVAAWSISECRQGRFQGSTAGWELPHSISAPSPSPPGTGCAGTARRARISEGLSCVQSSGLVHLAAISLPWAGCHSRLQHPGGLRVCSQLSKTAKL